jgi:glutathione S-transferase
MKMFYSPASPYVRKVCVVAAECGMLEKIENVSCAANPINRDQTIVASNPLGQVPTLIADDGTVFYDSGVICEYIDSLAGGKLFGSCASRWRGLVDHALGDGILGAALLARYETFLRPEALRWGAWTDGQFDKVAKSLDVIEQAASGYGSRVDIGTITIGCALGYLDFRFPALDWRSTHPQTARWFAAFDERPSMKATRPA